MQYQTVGNGAGISVSPLTPAGHLQGNENPRETALNGNGSRNGHPPAVAAGTLPGGGFQFRKAVKYDAKLRMALAGPGGSGKTYTALVIATALGGKIAVVDSEHGSASKYADQFEFDVLELDAFDPAVVPELIQQASEQGYSSLIFDSWSHFWMGQGGELEQVDEFTARDKSKNSWAAWRHVSPKHTRMIDAMLSAPIHILVTMRVKTDWVVDKDEKTGRTQPRKVGLQPVMREGVEYEFDVCGDLDQDNTFVVTKTRCPRLSGKIFAKPGPDMAAILREWLASPVQKPGTQPLPPVPARTSIDTGGHAIGTPQAAAAVARQKIASGNPGSPCPWQTFGEMKRIFLQLREIVGESVYLQELDRYGWKSANDIRSKPLAIECHAHLDFLAERELELRKGVA